MIIYCPNCAKKLKNIGISGAGEIYKCPYCKKEWLIKEQKEEENSDGK